MSLNAAEQKELASRMEKKQVREFVAMYSNLVQQCFDECATDFSTKKLKSQEEGCVFRCIDIRLKASERLGQRFAEQNQAMAQGGAPSS